MDISQAEFDGFPAPVPPAMVAPATPAERIARFQELERKHGGLVPVSMLADVIGVSRGRIFQFKEQSRFTVVEFLGREFTPLREIEDFVSLQRPPGRPLKTKAA